MSSHLSSITSIFSDIFLILRVVFEQRRLVTSQSSHQILASFWKERKYFRKENAVIRHFERPFNFNLACGQPPNLLYRTKRTQLGSLLTNYCNWTVVNCGNRCHELKFAL